MKFPMRTSPFLRCRKPLVDNNFVELFDEYDTFMTTTLISMMTDDEDVRKQNNRFKESFDLD